MNKLTPYLFFKGDCREAMTFYRDVLGGELKFMTYEDAQGKGGCPKGAEDKIINSQLSRGDLQIMASDEPSPEHAVDFGNNVQLALACDSLTQIENVFRAFSEGGDVLQPLHDAFWGDRFGMVRDRYGVFWMLTCTLPKKN